LLIDLINFSKMNDLSLQQDLYKRIALREQAVDTWAGGTTQEIAKYPPQSDKRSGNYLYWVGTATIERSASYSYFGGCSRVHMPIAGNGIELRFQDPFETVELGTYAQHSFSGERRVFAELIDGPVKAFNLVLGQGATGTIEVTTVTTEPMKISLGRDSLDVKSPGQLDGILYALNGRITVIIGDRREIVLENGDAFVIQLKASGTPQVSSFALKSNEGFCDVLIARVRRDASLSN
jgi:environmental stress-induced protein Ves